MTGTSVFAKPDFTRSTIEASTESPIEGEMVDFTIRLRNSGDVPANHSQLSIEWPLMGFLIDASGLDGLTLDDTNRKITGDVSLDAGQDSTIRLTILAPRRSAGDLLSVSVHLAHYSSSTELWEHQSVAIAPRPATGGFKIGGTRITAAGIAVITCLFVGLLIDWCLRLLNRQQKKLDSSSRSGSSQGRRKSLMNLSSPNGIAVALTIPALFWTIFTMMAWRDLQVLTSWVETDALIVGRREIVGTETNTARNRQGDATTFTPQFALKYKVNGTPIYSTGYDTGSSIRQGGRVLNEHEMATWKRGATITCWYNPLDPKDVVVRRGFGGAYFFALFPIPILWIGISSLNHFLRSVSVNAKRSENDG